MGRATLVNPFSLMPEAPPRIADARTGKLHRSMPICAACHSDDIVCHATMQWSNEAQEWQPTSTFRQPAHCNHCDSSCRIEWLTLD